MCICVCMFVCVHTCVCVCRMCSCVCLYACQHAVTHACESIHWVHPSTDPFIRTDVHTHTHAYMRAYRHRQTEREKCINTFHKVCCLGASEECREGLEAVCAAGARLDVRWVPSLHASCLNRKPRTVKHCHLPSSGPSGQNRGTLLGKSFCRSLLSLIAFC